MHQPPDSVLAAFDAHEIPVPLGGGQGSSWRAGQLVFKPADISLEELEWQTDVLGGLSPASVRLAPPVGSISGRLIIDGWTVRPFLEGRHEPGRWIEIIEAGRRLNRALASVARPDFLERRSGPWAEADRMTWDGAPTGHLMELAPIGRLAAMRRPIDAAGQVIHGDLCGNVLFSDHDDPAVIDFSPYWRPADYAVALVVGDALVSEEAPAELANVLDGGRDRGQLLVRALLFRAIVDGLVRGGPSAAAIARAYEPAIEIAESIERAS